MLPLKAARSGDYMESKEEARRATFAVIECGRAIRNLVMGALQSRVMFRMIEPIPALARIIGSSACACEDSKTKGQV
jgi:hypothetical protein